MNADEIIAKYKYIQYYADQWYYLYEMFPIVLRVKDYSDRVYLDTSGEMYQCDFGVFKIQDGYLYRIEGDEERKMNLVRVSDRFYGSIDFCATDKMVLNEFNSYSRIGKSYSKAQLLKTKLVFVDYAAQMRDKLKGVLG